jgi:hypothetical protein
VGNGIGRLLYSEHHLLRRGRDEVEAAARAAEKAINHRGFVARIESINTMDAWLALSRAMLSF